MPMVRVFSPRSLMTPWLKLLRLLRLGTPSSKPFSSPEALQERLLP
jgi:hypothetical protein